MKTNFKARGVGLGIVAFAALCCIAASIRVQTSSSGTVSGDIDVSSVDVTGNTASGFHPLVTVSNQNTANFSQYGLYSDNDQWGIGVGNSAATFQSLSNKFFIYDDTAQAVRFTIDRTGAGNIRSGILYGSGSCTAYGDSFTSGTGASTAATRYANVLASMVGWSLNNYGVSGKQVADVANYIYTNAPTTNSTFTYYLGANDQRNYVSNNEAPIFQSGHLCELAYLAIPASTNKLMGTNSAITYAGTWASSSLFGIGKQTTNNGATATATVFGNAVFVGYSIKDGNGGTFTIAVDGTNYGTFNSFAATPINTVHSQTYGPACFSVANLTNGPHTVVLTVSSSTDTNNIVWLDWIAGTGGASTKDGPRVYVANLPRMTSAGYVTWGGSDTNVFRFNDIIALNCSYLASLGLNVAMGDVCGVIDITTDLDADGLHPNDAGHAKIAQVFARLVNGLSYPAERQIARRPIPNLLWEPGRLIVRMDNNGWNEVMRIGNGGNVAMGTQDTNYAFTVSRLTSGGFRPLVAITNQNSTNYSQYGILSDTGNWGVGVANSGAAFYPTNFFIYDATRDKFRVVIDASGNITFPTTNATVYFSNNVSVAGNIVGSGGFTNTGVIQGNSHIYSVQGSGIGWTSGSSFRQQSDGHVWLQNNAASLIGSLQWATTNVIKTVNYSVAAMDVGKTFNNIGASGAITNTLPSAIAGMRYAFYIDAAQVLCVKAAASDTIRNGITGVSSSGSASAGVGEIYDNEQGAYLELFSPANGKWVASSKIGTWTTN